MGCCPQCSLNQDVEEFRVLQNLYSDREQYEIVLEDLALFVGAHKKRGGLSEMSTGLMDSPLGTLDNYDELRILQYFTNILERRRSHVNIDFRNVLMEHVPENRRGIILAYKNSNAVCVSDGSVLHFCVMNAGELFIFNDEPFQLVGFQLHCPSIHTFTNREYPLEMNFIHCHKITGEVAIVAQLFLVGLPSEFLDEIIKQKESVTIDEPFKIEKIDFDLYKDHCHYVCYDMRLDLHDANIPIFVNMAVTSCSSEQLAWIHKSIPYSLDIEMEADRDPERILRYRKAESRINCYE